MGTKNALSATVSTPTEPPPHMQAARVTKYDARRGFGVAILRASGKRVYLPWYALKELNTVLSAGQSIFVALDHINKARADAIFLP